MTRLRYTEEYDPEYDGPGDVTASATCNACGEVLTVTALIDYTGQDRETAHAAAVDRAGSQLLDAVKQHRADNHDPLTAKPVPRSLLLRLPLNAQITPGELIHPQVKEIIRAGADHPELVDELPTAVMTRLYILYLGAWGGAGAQPKVVDDFTPILEIGPITFD